MEIKLLILSAFVIFIGALYFIRWEAKREVLKSLMIEELDKLKRIDFAICNLSRKELIKVEEILIKNEFYKNVTNRSLNKVEGEAILLYNARNLVAPGYMFFEKSLAQVLEEKRKIIDGKEFLSNYKITLK